MAAGVCALISAVSEVSATSAVSESRARRACVENSLSASVPRPARRSLGEGAWRVVGMRSHRGCETTSMSAGSPARTFASALFLTPTKQHECKQRQRRNCDNGDDDIPPAPGPVDHDQCIGARETCFPVHKPHSFRHSSAISAVILRALYYANKSPRATALALALVKSHFLRTAAPVTPTRVVAKAQRAWSKARRL